MSLPGIEKIFLWADTHCPYVDLERVRVAAEINRDWKSDYCVGLGDTIDLAAVSKFPHVRDGHDIRDEIDSAVEVLDLMKPTHLRQGNHERRLARAGIIPQELFRLLDSERLLECERRKIKFYPYTRNAKLKFGFVSLIHGYGYGVGGLRALGNHYGCVICGHFHTQEISRPPSEGGNCMAACVGHLCRGLPYEIEEGVNRHCPGCAQLYVHKSGHFQLYLISLIGGTYAVNDRIYHK